MNNGVYNINTFDFYRRQIKQSDLDRAFIKLIEEEEKKNAEKEKLAKNESGEVPIKLPEIKKKNKDGEKNLNLNLIFPKISIERIMRIRDLFLEFDYDKNRTFDQDEVYSIFVMSNIPIKYEEVKELFGYNEKRKFISFSEFINLTINDSFSTKFKNLIMDKVRHRTKEGDICPNDFNDMLAYLSEFGKLSNDVKSQIREKNMNNLNSSKNLTDLDNKEVEKNGNDDSDKDNDKDKELPIIKTDSQKKNELEDENKIINNRTPNLKNKEFEFKNFMEINNQKLLRFREYFIKANIRDKILQKKRKVSQSVNFIDNNYQNLAKNYICYFPTENVFKRIKDNSELSFISRRNRKRYNTIHADSNSNIDSNKRGSVIYNVYLNKQKKPKKKMYFESVEVKKKKVDNLESEKIYNSLLSKAKKDELAIPKIPANKRMSYQFGLLRFNKNKITENNILQNLI